MKLPRNLPSGDLIKALRVLGYEISRQSGSHIRLTTQKEGEHYITIPEQSSIRIGTLNSILGEVSSHFNMSKNDLLKILKI